MRTTAVFDRLIHSGEIAVTIGVFVVPGIFADDLPEKLGWEPPPANRSVEYDTPSTDVRGGDCYPGEILAAPPKPLRVFLQAARRDIGFDQPHCNWYSANLRMAAALAERGYDHRLVLGDGGHDPDDAGEILPDALRWLLR